MKTYTFKTGTTYTYNNFPKSTNYSKTLDDIILTSVTKNNSYLFNKPIDKHDSLIDSLINKSIGFKTAALKGDDEFINAVNFLANYKTKKSIPFIIGKTYKLANGKYICFYDDEFQINEDIYSYSDFDNFDFINALTPEKKKIIIDIYTNSKNINITIS